jgi:hypothetical protein
MITRETIYDAFFDKISSIADFKVKSRRVKHWGDVSPADMPALFISQRVETPIQEKKLPTKWQLSVDVIIYVNSGGDHNVVPASIINPLVDKLEQALKPDQVSGYTTLNIPGVSHCWIGGAVEYDEGALGDFGVVIVPVEILAI